MNANWRQSWVERTGFHTVRALALSTAAFAGLCSCAVSRSLAESQNSSPAGTAAREAESALTPAEASTPPGNSARRALKLRAVSSQTGRPIKGVDFQFFGRVGGEAFHTSVVSGEDGTVNLSWLQRFAVQNIWFTARAAGFVPVDYNWGDDHHAVEVPEFVELRFEPGQPIGGVVRDEAGHPIAGVTIQTQLPVTWSTNSGLIFFANTTKADAQGRWTWREAPADCSQVKIQIDHPQYQHSWAQGARSQQLVYVLKRRPNSNPDSSDSLSSKKKL
jgi:hypothetical protein